MPLGPWKNWLNQETIPLPFLLVTDCAEVLGVKIYEKWADTLRSNGNSIVEKVTGLGNKWKSGRFYPFSLRPKVVNTYLYSNIWYRASVLTLRLGDTDKLQRIGNNYVYKDSFLRPERVVNYISKDRTGLGLVHVKSKGMGLFIKNILGEATSDCYCQAQPSPVKQRLAVARSAGLRLALLSLLNHPPIRPPTHPGIVVLKQEIVQIQKTLINNNSPTNQTKGNRDNNKIK